MQYLSAALFGVTLYIVAVVVLLAATPLVVYSIRRTLRHRPRCGTCNARSKRHVRDHNGLVRCLKHLVVVAMLLGGAASAHAQIPSGSVNIQDGSSTNLLLVNPDGSINVNGGGGGGSSVTQGTTPWVTREQPDTTPLAGQLAVTDVETCLPVQATRSACVKADISNTLPVFVGPTGLSITDGFPLYAGDGLCAPIANTSSLCVIAVSAGPNAAWFGTAP